MIVEKVPVRSVGEPQARAKGNHDNPVSGNHPGTVTLNTQWKNEYLPMLTQREGRDGRDGSKAFLELYMRHNMSKMVDINRGAVNLLRPCKTPGAAPPNLRE